MFAGSKYGFVEEERERERGVYIWSYDFNHQEPVEPADELLDRKSVSDSRRRSRYLNGISDGKFPFSKPLSRASHAPVSRVSRKRFQRMKIIICQFWWSLSYSRVIVFRWWNNYWDSSSGLPVTKHRLLFFTAILLLLYYQFLNERKQFRYLITDKSKSSLRLISLSHAYETRKLWK